MTLSASASSLSIQQAGSAQLTIATAASPAASAVSLAVSGVPSGVQASFASPLVTAGSNAVVTLAASPSAALGTYTITVTGTMSGVTKTLGIQLKVLAQPAFDLGLSSQFITVRAGGPSVPVTMSIAALASGFNSPISLMVRELRPTSRSALRDPR